MPPSVSICSSCKHFTGLNIPKLLQKSCWMPHLSDQVISHVRQLSSVQQHFHKIAIKTNMKSTDCETSASNFWSHWLQQQKVRPSKYSQISLWSWPTTFLSHTKSWLVHTWGWPGSDLFQQDIHHLKSSNDANSFSLLTKVKHISNSSLGRTSYMTCPGCLKLFNHLFQMFPVI